MERTAWFVPEEPSVVSLDTATLEDLGRAVRGDGGVSRGRFVDVAIRACLLTGAGVRVVPAAQSLNEGIGAILRW
jgi:hypothetical protein